MIKTRLKRMIGFLVVPILAIGTLCLVAHKEEKEYTSAHFGEREQPIRHLVIHSFSLSVPEMIRRLDALGVSTHYLIDTDGRIIRLVPEDKVAWHAGKSYWRGQSGLNATSIGIELQNKTLGQTPFTVAQLEAFKKLAQDLMKRYHIDPRNVVAHSDIAPARKVDVGKAFPWKKMAEAGIGLWPREKVLGTIKAGDIAMLLAQIGYDTTDMNKALLAFERRFMPEVVATDLDIAHLEENLKGVQPVDTPAVRRRLMEVAQTFQ